MHNYRFLFLFFLPLLGFGQDWKPQNGSKDSRNHYTAFKNANIYSENGEMLRDATLLIQKNKIISLGKSPELPKNTLIIDLKGKFIYPSFIDLYSHYGIEKIQKKEQKSRKRPQIESKKANQFYWNESIHPEVSSTALFQPNSKSAGKIRKMGFGTVLTHQQDGIIRGTGTVVSLLDQHDDQRQAVLKSEAAMEYAFKKGSSKQTYPNSLMGIIALIRQVHYDLRYYQSATDVPYNHSLEALKKANEIPKIMDALNTASLFRADKIAKEFDFQFILKGNGTEYERAEEVKAMNAPLIVPVNFPKPYDVTDPYDARNLSLSQMKSWELAPYNLGILAKKEVPFAITADGVENSKTFFDNLKKALQSGLSSKDLIHALTMKPAELIRMDQLLGSLSPGKLANFIICADSISAKDFKIHSNWVQGKEYPIQAIEEIALAGNYNLQIKNNLSFKIKVEKDSKGKWKATVKEKENDQTTTNQAKLKINHHRISLSFKTNEKLYQLSGSINDSLSRIWSGKTLIDGKWINWAAIKMSVSTMGSPPESTKKPGRLQDSTSLPTIYYPNMAYGWDSLPNTQKPIIFRNATIWTNEEEGILKNHDLLIAEGKIKMVGYKINLELMFPEYAEEVEEIDAKGKHLTSGIVDEHSHIAISRGVNESGQAITSEVRIGDVINSEDINIYRQLAGGVTTSQLLHGSANPIGGQSAIIKLRWGYPAEKMKIDSADGFIKFALGENVKQSNWGDHRTVRFPQSRMGVEQVFYDGFIRAKSYQQEWKLYQAKSKRDRKKTTAPRKDLELQALAEILDSSRFITCHSYIQSEVNMLMHVADSLGFQVNTFTHILEGYKLANKIKAHGAAASTFSDWWAYKFEVNDAIPYNGAILHQQGVLTGFNSDDAEMGRRLNQEAAKAVKYGGVSEEEAWKFVTLNPAKMLHLDDQIGSIKAGKDADLVLWSNQPLSIKAKAEQTYIDGIRFYDQERDQLLRKKIQEERSRLIGLMLAAKEKGADTQKVKPKENKRYECDHLEP